MSCCAGGRAVTRSRRRHLKQYGMLGWAMERAPVPSGRPRVGCDGERKGRRGGVRELTCRTEAYQPHLHGWFEGFRRSYELAEVPFESSHQGLSFNER